MDFSRTGKQLVIDIYEVNLIHSVHKKIGGKLISAQWILWRRGKRGLSSRAVMRQRWQQRAGLNKRNPILPMLLKCKSCYQSLWLEKFFRPLCLILHRSRSQIDFISLPPLFLSLSLLYIYVWNLFPLGGGGGARNIKTIRPLNYGQFQLN